MNYSPPLVRLDYDGTDMVPEMATPVLFGVDEMEQFRLNLEWLEGQRRIMAEFVGDLLICGTAARPAR